jgi:hypothetical protein
MSRDVGQAYRKKVLLSGIEENDWNEADRKGRGDARNDDDRADDVHDCRKVTSQCRHQLTINRVHVLREPIDNSPNRCRIKERHRGMHNNLKQVGKDLY